MTLKEKVTYLCKEQKISVRELERRAGLKQRTIQHWDESEPSGLKLYAVANVLEVPIEELLSVYEDDLKRVAYIEELKKQKPATNKDDGQTDNIKFDTSNASDDQRELIQAILQMPADKVSAFLAFAKLL